MEWIKDVLVLVFGGLFSGAVITSLLFYRQIRDEHQANADKTKADADKARAEASGVKVASLGKAIELLRNENERLSNRLDRMQEMINALQERVNTVCAENAALKDKINSVEIENALLKDKLTRLRRVLFELRKGLTLMIAQVCEIHLEPAYRIPEDVLEWIEEDPAEEDNGKPS